MNYGMGGHIYHHRDSTNDDYEQKENTGEAMRYGGSRILTFMIYLSDVESGGHTIFPHLGVSVKPVKGAALFWFNYGPKMNYSTQQIHFGCPVAYGNKWIANKWIKFNAQFKTYLCKSDCNHFSILNTN